MKKLLMVGLLLFLVFQTVAFGEEVTYEVTFDGQVQKFVGQKVEESVYIPYTGLVVVIGKENLPQVDQTQLNMINIDGFDYISSDAVQLYFNVIAIRDDKEKQLKFYTVKAMLDKFQVMEDDLKKTAPDLYEALNRTMSDAYSYQGTINGMLEIDYANQEMAETMGINNIFYSMDVRGYINTIKEDFEILMDMKLDASPMMKESFQDIGIKKVDDAVYVFNPTCQSWVMEKIDQSILQEQTALMASDSKFLWVMAKDMKRSQKGNIITYKATYTEKDIESLIDTLAGQGAYKDFLAGIKEQGMGFSIDQVDATYTIEDGYLKNQFSIINCSFEAMQGNATMVVQSESNYGDYGVKKKIMIPTVLELPIEIQ